MNAIARHVRNGGSYRGIPARPYFRRDVFESLPYHRARFIKQRAAGHPREFTEYGWMLKRAMRPVSLPSLSTNEGGR